MKRDVYQRGVKGKKYGIWNVSAKCFQFGICEDTPMLAVARLYQKIGDDAKKWRFEPRMLPDEVKEEKPVKPCNGCEHLSLTEAEQDAVKSQGGGCPPHICRKYNKRVTHYPFREPQIHPCEECVKEATQ